MTETYTREEVLEATKKYFDGDELASNVWVDKYCLRDKEDRLYELTPDAMFDRLTDEIIRIEQKYSKPLSREVVRTQLDHFKYILFSGSPMSGIGNPYRLTSLSNCTVVSAPRDNMSSIYECARDIANLCKCRAGVGLHINNLRPEETPVSNSARTSSGSWSFADLFSYVVRHVGQSGRRGALLIAMSCMHPDVMKFIISKTDKKKITGANISVFFTDDFMRAVRDDQDFELRWPIEGEPVVVKETIKARKLWNLFVETNRTSAEPGAAFIDTICNNSPAHFYPRFKTSCCNPCGEIFMSENDECRLLSINLASFVENGEMNFPRLQETCVIATRLSDDLIDLELEKLTQLKNKACSEGDDAAYMLWDKMVAACQNGRRVGIGSLGWADAFSKLKMIYGSSESILLAEKLSETMRNTIYAASIDLAKERGAFPIFDAEVEKDCLFIQRLPGLLRQPRRNISLLTIAPTGSIALLAQVSSGVEPVFKHVYTRRRKVKGAVDFVDVDGETYEEYTIHHPLAKKWLDEHPGEPLPEYFIDAENVAYEDKIDLLSAIQRNIDHSISSTLNLPANTTSETISKIYMQAWEFGLKGITVYVEGSRSGILIDKKKPEADFAEHFAPKRPKELPAEIFRCTIKGEKWIVLVGLMAGRPYEVFCGLMNKVAIPSAYKTGTIIKNRGKNNTYDLRFGEDGEVKDIISTFDNHDHAVLTRLISLGLRHGSPPQFIVEQLQRDAESSMQSFCRVVARVLKRFVEDGVKPTTDKTCPVCGEEALIYQEGCLFCTNCSTSKCG